MVKQSFDRKQLPNGLMFAVQEKHKEQMNQDLANPESGTRIRHDLELLDEFIQKGFKTLSLNDAVIQRMEDVP